jgi:class 3 adenylate cyclase
LHQRPVSDLFPAIIQSRDLRIELRIGIHVGDIIIDDADIFGDGVNIAARLEGIARVARVTVKLPVFGRAPD